MVELIDALSQFGPAGVVIAFLLWDHSRRETRYDARDQRLAERLEARENYIINELSTIVKNNTDAMRDFAAALRRLRVIGDEKE